MLRNTGSHGGDHHESNGFNEAGAGCSGILGGINGRGGPAMVASMRPELGAPEYYQPKALSLSR